MAKDPYGPCYRAMRPEVLARNDGICQACGIQQSAHTHHAMVNYPDHVDLRIDQLTALCADCHDFLTHVRKWQWRFNASPGQVYDVLVEYLRTPEFAQRLREIVGADWRRASSPDARAEPQSDIAHRSREQVTASSPVARSEQQSDLSHRSRPNARDLF